LRFHQRQHHLHGNRRIDRRAARLEHLVARIGCQRVGGSDGKLRHGPARLGLKARRPLGLGRLRIFERTTGGGATGNQRGNGSGNRGRYQQAFHAISWKKEKC
jgi:hypothetical protein